MENPVEVGSKRKWIHISEKKKGEILGGKNVSQGSGGEVRRELPEVQLVSET